MEIRHLCSFMDLVNIAPKSLLLFEAFTKKLRKFASAVCAT